MQRLFLIAGLLMTSGCGESRPEAPQLVPVVGIVRFQGDPLRGADLRFYPEEDTPGNGGVARTNDGGAFKITYARGGDGLPVGNYRVTVSLRLMPDGTPVPEDDDTPPIESPARESLALIFSDFEQSKLTVAIKPNTPIQLELNSSASRK